jgi:hypothetical protein
MSVSDVANLLIALSSGASAKDSVDEVRRIRGFKRRPAEGTLRSAALDGLIEGDEFGAFCEHLLTLQIDGKLQPMLSSLPIDLFPINPALANLSRAHGITISKQLEQKAASKTDFYIDFEIDDDFVSVDINRYYDGRANVVDGALFFAEDSDMERTPGIVTSRKLLNWAIYHIVALLSEGPASRGDRSTMERPAGQPWRPGSSTGPRRLPMSASLRTRLTRW